MLLPSSSKAPVYPDLLSVPRLTSLFASLLVAICSGTNYVYSAYAPQLGARLQINHTQLSMIGLAGNIGVYISSPVWGRIVDSQGPRMLLASGFFLLLAGYSGVRYIFDAGIQSDATTISTFTLCLLVACKLATGAGGNCGVTSALNSTAKTFPDRARGLATGIVVSGFGLSAFLFSAMARTMYPGDTSAFLKLLAYGTALPMILGIFFVRPIPLPPASADHASAVNMNVGREEGRGSGEEERLLNPHEDEVEESRYVTAHDNEAVSPNVYGRALFMKSDFWLLFVIVSLLTGTGLMFINNVGSMSQALYFDATAGKGKPYDPVEALRWQTAQVSAISITNFAGRIAIGLTSDLLKRTLSLPRSASLTIVSLLFLSSQIAAASISDITHLEIASLMLGFAHGSVFSLGPTVCIEWFGMPHFSENWGYLIISPMFGGNLLSLAFGRDMDRHSRAHYQPQPSSSTINVTAEARCEMGRMCYVDTLYLTAGVCMLATVLSVWAGWRDWKRGVGRLA